MGITPNITNITNNADPPYETCANSPVTKRAFAPFVLLSAASSSIPPQDEVNSALQYNPRCLTRDLNPNWSALTTTGTVTNLLNCGDMKCLEQRADGWEDGASNCSHRANQIHPAAHFTIGGLNNDPLASPGDPVFFLHHAMMDRVWSIWQGQATSRIDEVGGTETPFNSKQRSQLFILRALLTPSKIPRVRMSS